MRTKRNALADALSGVDPSPLPQPRYAPFGPLPANGLNFAPLPSPFAPYPLATYLREPALTELYPVWGEPAPVVRNRLDRSAIEEILRHHSTARILRSGRQATRSPLLKLKPRMRVIGRGSTDTKKEPRGMEHRRGSRLGYCAKDRPSTEWVPVQWDDVSSYALHP